MFKYWRVLVVDDHVYDGVHLFCELGRVGGQLLGRRATPSLFYFLHHLLTSLRALVALLIAFSFLQVAFLLHNLRHSVLDSLRLRRRHDPWKHWWALLDVTEIGIWTWTGTEKYSHCAHSKIKNKIIPSTKNSHCSLQ